MSLHALRSGDTTAELLKILSDLSNRLSFMDLALDWNVLTEDQLWYGIVFTHVLRIQPSIQNNTEQEHRRSPLGSASIP